MRYATNTAYNTSLQSVDKTTESIFILHFFLWKQTKPNFIEQIYLRLFVDKIQLKLIG